MRLRISARSSDLARIQAYEVGAQLQKKHPELVIEYLFRESLGDKNLSDPLWKMPEKGVFTEDFYQDLQTQKTDLVVHSWKDLPTELKPDTIIAATLNRADQRDLLLYKKNHHRREKIKILSSSPRRAYNLNHFFKKSLPWKVENIEFANIRGNVPTRIRKLLEQQDADGLILAKAALDRLVSAPGKEFEPTQKFLIESMKQLDWQVLPLSLNPTAAAQGALAVEVLSSRKEILSLVQSIQVQGDYDRVQKERNILSSYGGGCHQKIGISIVVHPQLNLSLMSLQGLTDGGEKLDEWKVLQEIEDPVSYSESELLDSRDLWENTVRQVLPVELQVLNQLQFSSRPVLVAKHEAWNSKNLSQPQLLWCSGLKTWYELAAQGLWVHGSLDSMGEDQLPVLQPWMNLSSNQWLKISHDQSAEAKLQTLATYKIERQLKKGSLANVKMIYWRSASEYNLAVQSYPEIRNIKAASGLGSTALILKSRVYPNLSVYTSVEEWRKKCLS